MKKSLITLLTIIPIGSATPIMPNLQNIRVSNAEDIQYVNQAIAINKHNETFSSDDLNMIGQNYSTLYRIYIDDTGDKTLPDEGNDNTDDYIVVQPDRATWYNHLIHGLSIDTTKYAANKTEFLNKYRAFSVSYFYKYNFWNEWDGWSYAGGKSSPLIGAVKTFKLTSDNTKEEIFRTHDPNHADNESAKLNVEQMWNGNILKINFYLSAWVSRTWGSLVGHATLAEFTADSYTLIAVPKNENDPNDDIAIVQDVTENSKFLFDSYAKDVSKLSGVNDSLKSKTDIPEIRNAWFKTASVVLQSYYGSKTVGNKRYFLSILISWNSSTLPVIDSTLLLNNAALSREITKSSISSSGDWNFLYENSLGKSEKIFMTPFDDSNYLDIELSGAITVPFIYTV